MQTAGVPAASGARRAAVKGGALMPSGRGIYAAADQRDEEPGPQR